MVTVCFVSQSQPSSGGTGNIVKIQRESCALSTSWISGRSVITYSERVSWRCCSSGMWHGVVGHVGHNISEDCSALVFRVKQSKQTAWPWRWQHCDPLKRWELHIRHNVTFQKNSVFSNTAVRTLYVVGSWQYFIHNFFGLMWWTYANFRALLLFMC